MSLIHVTDSDNCAKVYQTWKSARSALSESIKVYLRACDVLASVSIETLAHTMKNLGGSLPDALSLIDAELSGLVEEEESLRTARLTLLASRNNAGSFSKINSLPFEILSSIFLFANPYPTEDCMPRGTVYPTALSGVCQRWRQVTLEIPSLWSHIRFSINGPQLYSSHRCAELWGERSKDAGLSIDVLDFYCDRSTEIMLLNLEPYLDPLLPRVRCLTISASHHFARATMFRMIAHSSPGSLNALSVTCRKQLTDTNNSDTVEDHLLMSCSSSMLESAERLLSSVQHLTLSNAAFSWNSSAYHGLVELRLEFSEDGGILDWPPSQEKMAAILSSSPMLDTLSLKIDYMWHVHDTPIEPIRLNNLRHLTFEVSDRRLCLGLLPLLAPAPSSLSVCVFLHSNPALWEELWSFSQRSRITTLRVCSQGSNNWVVPLSRHFAHLESLTLEGYTINRRMLRDFTSMKASTGASPWPQLHTLRLEDCSIDGGYLKSLVELLQIRKVRICCSCSIDVKPKDSVERTSPDTTAMQELQQQISLVVPDMKYYPSGGVD